MANRVSHPSLDTYAGVPKQPNAKEERARTRLRLERNRQAQLVAMRAPQPSTYLLPNYLPFLSYPFGLNALYPPPLPYAFILLEPKQIPLLNVTQKVAQQRIAPKNVLPVVEERPLSLSFCYGSTVPVSAQNTPQELPKEKMATLRSAAPSAAPKPSSLFETAKLWQELKGKIIPSLQQPNIDTVKLFFNVTINQSPSIAYKQTGISSASLENLEELLRLDPSLPKTVSQLSISWGAIYKHTDGKFSTAFGEEARGPGSMITEENFRGGKIAKQEFLQPVFDGLLERMGYPKGIPQIDAQNQLIT